MTTTPTQQPEALKLADVLHEVASLFSFPSALLQSAAELRRLHAENEALRAVVADAVAAERVACEERVVSLFEVLETPYLPDITRAIHASDKA